MSIQVYIETNNREEKILINKKRLGLALEKHLVDEGYDPSDAFKRITIKRKKKMIPEKMSNGNVKQKRRNIIKIEIIE